MKPENFDAIIIGAGQAGGPFSTTLARAGLKTALIEKEHVGGTCINEGCTPTKTMIASGRVAHMVNRAPDYGVMTSIVRIDMEKIRQRKRDIVESFRNGSQKRIENTDGLDLIFGEASFTEPNEILVKKSNGQLSSLSAKIFVINTGTRAMIPSISGLSEVPFLTSTTIMEIDHVPEKLLVIGGGYIGVEFGQLFSRLGSKVSIVERDPYLLRREDVDVSKEVAKILTEDGIEVYVNTETLSVETNDGGDILLTVEQNGARMTLSGTNILTAAGRIPNSDSLNLKNAAIEADVKGFIKVNDKLETSAEGVYAVGDVKGGAAFTHISYDDFRVLRTNLVHKGNAVTKNRLVPYTVFIDPQLGRIGMNEEEARRSGRQFRTAKIPMTHVARAIEMDETRGFMKAIVDNESGQILGAAVLGVEGGEIASILQVAMMGKLHYSELKEGIFSHPTLAESLNTLFMSLDN